MGQRSPCFSAKPQDFRLHLTEVQEITVPVAAGENTLTWYVRADYDRTWARLQYRFIDPDTEARHERIRDDR